MKQGTHHHARRHGLAMPAAASAAAWWNVWFMARPVGSRWAACTLPGLLALAPPVLASNEVGAICALPVLLLTPLLSAMGVIAIAMLPACLFAGHVVGRRVAPWFAAHFPTWVPLALVVGGLIYTVGVGHVGLGLADAPRATVRVMRCPVPADLLRGAGLLFWLPAALLAGVASGLIRALRAGETGDAGELAATTPALPERHPAAMPAASGKAAPAAVGPDDAAARRALVPPAPLPAEQRAEVLAKGFGLGLPKRVPLQPVDAETRARIAAAVARQKAHMTTQPPPLPWQRSGTDQPPGSAEDPPAQGGPSDGLP